MPTPTLGTMREVDWISLTSSIEAGRCILMLGPDAFMARFDGEELPVAVGLARFIKERLGDKYADLDPLKPWVVAQVAVAEEDPNALRAWVHEFYNTYNTESEVINNLAALPFQVIINTSPGLVAPRAFTRSRSRTHVAYYDRTAPVATGPFPDPSPNAPLLYGLYGSVDKPSSMILSENDRFDFLISIITGCPPLPEKLTSALCDPQNSFLFLGFNLVQWQLRMLMYVILKKTRRENKSFALEMERQGVDDEARLFYMSGHKVHFVDIDLLTLTDELRRRVRQVSDLDEDALDGKPAPDAPTVFLCHAHEDAAFADRLSTDLRHNKINVWLDKDDLRGGVLWDERIESVLEEEVQYVVVLQSKALQEKQVGYVNKEIRLALKRREHYRSPRIFVIPAIIDFKSSALGELKEIQSVDLTATDGLDNLVKTIYRDLNFGRRLQ